MKLRHIILVAGLLAALPGTARAENYGPPAPALVAVVIDDMGLDARRSARALQLPAEVTLAYLPYAREVGAQAAQARAAGHEVILHMPMAANGHGGSPGPEFLSPGDPSETVRTVLGRGLDALAPHAIGVNNHMGSGFTADRAGMAVVMEVLRERGMLFLDSRTTAASVAEEEAQRAGVAATRRNVFLDDQPTEAFTAAALRKLERHAREHGAAVAIGHPKDITLRALEAWLPTLGRKGLRLAPLTAVVRHRENQTRVEPKSCPVDLSYLSKQ